MGDPEAPARLIGEVESVLGPVDILVANHGLGRQATYQEVDATAFDQTLAINLRAPFLLAQRVLPGMGERGFGRILFISSVAAFRGGVVGPHYAASKAGLHGLAHFLASRVAGDGVTVNVLAPGFIETAMLPDDPEKLAQSIPIGRTGRPEEVADLALAILRNGYHQPGAQPRRRHAPTLSALTPQQEDSPRGRQRRHRRCPREYRPTAGGRLASGRRC